MAIDPASSRSHPPQVGEVRRLGPAKEGPAPWTFEELHSAYARDLTRFVARRMRDRELARDVVQETFLRAYRAREAFDHDKPVWPWLATIARNLILNALRDENRRRIHLHGELDWEELAAAIDQRSETDPEKSYSASQRRAAIAAALLSLTPRQRRVLLLRAAEDLSYEDIAAREDLSIDAVKSLLKRARQAFRETYRTIDGERVLPAGVLGPLAALWTQARGQFGRLRDRVAHAADVARYPGPTMEAMAQALSTSGVAGILLLSTLLGSPSEDRGPTTTTTPDRAFVLRATTGAPAMGRAPVLRQPTRDRATPHSRSEVVVVEGALTRDGPDRRTLRIVIVRDAPVVPGNGEDVFVDVPCESAQQRAACEAADQLFPGDDQ